MTLPSRRGTRGGVFCSGAWWAPCRAASMRRPTPRGGRGWLRNRALPGVRGGTGTCRASCVKRPPCSRQDRAARRRVRVLAFGDFGEHGTSRQERVGEAMARYHADKHFDLAITLGDNFYPAGLATPTDERWQQEFERIYGPLRIPFFASLGNHDWVLADSPAAEILHSGRSDRWRLPALRYSFVAGPVQFFALDTNLVTRAELDWLDAELARSGHAGRWSTVTIPFTRTANTATTRHCAISLLPILRGRANLYICGHEHSLQHITAEDGVHFVIAGGGGAGTYPTKPAPRSLFAASQNGFAVIEADPQDAFGQPDRRGPEGVAPIQRSRPTPATHRGESLETASIRSEGRGHSSFSRKASAIAARKAGPSRRRRPSFLMCTALPTKYPRQPILPCPSFDVHAPQVALARFTRERARRTLPLLQVLLPGQAIPHAEQLSLLVSRFTQFPEQRV